jgi:hypothetical protein
VAHSCPACGQWCHCSGDIDDIECRSPDWVWQNCTCCDENDYTCWRCGAEDGEPCLPSCEDDAQAGAA